LLNIFRDNFITYYSIIRLKQINLYGYAQMIHN